VTLPQKRPSTSVVLKLESWFKAGLGQRCLHPPWKPAGSRKGAGQPKSRRSIVVADSEATAVKCSLVKCYHKHTSKKSAHRPSVPSPRTPEECGPSIPQLFRAAQPTRNDGVHLLTANSRSVSSILHRAFPAAKGYKYTTSKCSYHHRRPKATPPPHTKPIMTPINQPTHPPAEPRTRRPTPPTP